MADEQMAREWRLEMAKAIHRKNDLCRRDGVEESWDSGYECACFEMADAALALLARRALEEAKWWAKNGTHGFITDEAVERITELEQAAAYKVAGGERT